MYTKNFSKAHFSHSLPPLLVFQRESWERFWEEGLDEIVREVFPIEDYTGKQFRLEYLGYTLGKPKYKTAAQAKDNNAAYDIPLKIKVRLRNLKTKETSEQEIFVTDIPMMTENGSFVINGVERVVVSQLIRSSGVFFTSKTFKGRQLFGSNLIPLRGAWLEFSTDVSGFIGVKVNRQRKVPASAILRMFGYSTDEQIRKQFKDLRNKGGENQPDYIEKTLEKDPTSNSEEAFIEVYQRLRPGDMASADAAKDLLWNMFFNFQRYDLGKVGRWKIARRLPEAKKEMGKRGIKSDKIPEKERVLQPSDIVYILREIIRLNNNPEAQPDQVDHLGNRRIKGISELLQSRIRVGLMRMKRIIQDKMSTVESLHPAPGKLVNPKPLMAVIQKFLASSSLSQFMDEENPLGGVEHKRRLTATGPGGLTRERAGFEVRDVQPSHYGRVCPIQTPEGQNVGLIMHLASYTRINRFGFLETPYFRVKNGKVISSQVDYLGADQEEKYCITHGGVKLDEKGKIIRSEVKARYKGGPQTVKREEVNYMDVSPNQTISAATGIIPFLQNDDANRALMGSNMQRQAAPLINPDPPLVGTGLEKNVARDCGESILAEEGGKVDEVDSKKITIKSKNNNTKTYYLKQFERSNQYTCYHQQPVVKKGDNVKKGELITNGACISEGRLSLGKNVLVSFLPFRGGNFEDAVVFSERLIKDDSFTSIHIEDFSCDVRETKRGPEITTCDIPNVAEDKLKDLDEEGIVRVGAQVGPGDILVGKISPGGERALTAEERLLKAIFGEKAKQVKDTSLRMEHGKRGKVIRVKVFSREDGHKLKPGTNKKIRVEIAQFRKTRVGDKFAGRHGNKGVVAKILPEEEMPFLKDGTPIDVVLNPAGVISRMNLGQVLETHLGWAAHENGYRAETPSLFGATPKDIEDELERAGLPRSGQISVYDGKTGKPFSEDVTVGYMYFMKLVHMVEDKIHARSIGPYSLITQQPLGGKAQFGGQRFGEMEVWALEGHGAAHSLQEMLTIKSDDVPGRSAAYEAILQGEEIKKPHLPASFNLLVSELKSLALDVEIKGAVRDE